MKIRLTLIVLTAMILGLISNYALSTLDDVYKKHLIKTYFNEFTPEFSEINQNISKASRATEKMKGLWKKNTNI